MLLRAIPLLALAALLAAGASGCKRHAPASTTSSTEETATAGPDGRVRVQVAGDGYHPASVHAAPGRPVTLVFTRTSDEGCGQEVVFPALNLRRDLPLNQPVEVTVTPPAGAPLAFTCGMGMMRGAVVAR